MLAPAKINLSLHIIGQRADEYHLLDSLVVFADYGDKLTAIPNGFEIAGPFSNGLADTPDHDNLILKAAEAFGVANGTPATAIGFRLEKNLPVASGIGGGSADCAAALVMMNSWFNKPFDANQLAKIGAQLGADVPVCLRGQPSRMGGVGDDLSDVPPLPDMALLLVNPGIAVSTPKVFGALSVKDNPAMSMPNAWHDYGDFVDWLAAQRNDLQDPAIANEPAISSVLAALHEADLARMSGSGATIFGVFADLAAAEQAGRAIAQTHPDWWVQAASVRR
ncbi:MAG: 4-(cytidine 5'-diphospho)-2-C-methyl-D-erythritol kinase [Alphaproteobacteria bacterium]